MIFGLLAWSIGSKESLRRGSCHTLCKGMCGSVTTQILKSMQEVTKKVAPGKINHKNAIKILTNFPIQLKKCYRRRGSVL